MDTGELNFALVVWAGIGPLLTGLGAAFVTQWWGQRRERERRQFEREQWEAERDREDELREEKRERARVSRLREAMHRYYSRFVSLGADLSQRALSARDWTEGLPEEDETFTQFSEAYHQVLLLASNETAKPAVRIWKSTKTLVSKSLNADELEELKEEISESRSKFVREARKDLEDPVGRHANPGIKVQPALSLGGFNVSDVG